MAQWHELEVEMVSPKWDGGLRGMLGGRYGMCTVDLLSVRAVFQVVDGDSRGRCAGSVLLLENGREVRTMVPYQKMKELVAKAVTEALRDDGANAVASSRELTEERVKRLIYYAGVRMGGKVSSGVAHRFGFVPGEFSEKIDNILWGDL